MSEAFFLNKENSFDGSPTTGERLGSVIGGTEDQHTVCNNRVDMSTNIGVDDYEKCMAAMEAAKAEAADSGAGEG